MQMQVDGKNLVAMNFADQLMLEQQVQATLHILRYRIPAGKEEAVIVFSFQVERLYSASISADGVEVGDYVATRPDGIKSGKWVELLVARLQNHLTMNERFGEVFAVTGVLFGASEVLVRVPLIAQ